MAKKKKKKKKQINNSNTKTVNQKSSSKPSENKSVEKAEIVLKEKNPVKTEKKAEIENNNSFPQKIISLLGLKTKTDYVICMIGAAIIVALVALAILLFCGAFQTSESRAATVEYYGRDESDMSVSLISSSVDEQRIMSDEMKLDVENPKFDFYCLQEFEYSDSSSIIPMSLANPSYNKCILVFTITNGEGEILYRSLGVRPGYVLTYISLTRNIPYGENNLKLYVTAFKEKQGKDGVFSYPKVGNSVATLKLIHTATQEVVTEQ